MTILIISYFLKSLQLLFQILLLLDFLQLFFFSLFFEKKEFKISVFGFKRIYIKEIFDFSIPMFFSIMVGTISINIDKLLIGKLMSIEEFALYTNMSRELPFAFIISSFTSIIMPKIVRMLQEKDLNNFQVLYSSYIELGYIVTWTLAFGLFCIAPITIEFLYSSQYLDHTGINVFRIYLLVATFRFTYFGMIPAALGKTKIIFWYTFIAISVNIILNYPFFYFWGMVGPSFATLVSMLISAILYFRTNLRLVGLKLNSVLHYKNLIWFVLSLIIASIIQNIFIMQFNTITKNNFLRLSIGYALFILIVFFFERKRIIIIIKNLNEY